MKLGIAINVTNKMTEMYNNVINWRLFKTKTVISVFSNGKNVINNGFVDFFRYKKQYREKRIETPLTLVDAVRPLMDIEDLDFIIWNHCDYHYLDEDILLRKLKEIKNKKLGGASHMDCSFCHNSNEYRGIRSTMGDVRCASAYCLILTPDFIRKHRFLDMKPFTSNIRGLKDGGTADTFTAHFYKYVGEDWYTKILDLPRHGPMYNNIKYNSFFPDSMMVHSHLNKTPDELRGMFSEEINNERRSNSNQY